jgi:hypothetical protein
MPNAKKSIQGVVETNIRKKPPIAGKQHTNMVHFLPMAEDMEPPSMFPNETESVRIVAEKKTVLVDNRVFCKITDTN